MSKSKKAWRAASWPILALGFAAPVLTNCGGAGGLPGASNLPGGANLPGGSCPDLSSAEAIDKVDFVANFKVEAEAGAKLKAGLGASVELKAFADSVDADLKNGCGGLAKDLGGTGTYATGEEACKAAVKAMGDAKAKLGAVKVAITMRPPECRASMSAYADCAGHCDATVKPGEAKVECEPGKLSGSCSAQCTGSCDLSAAAKCDGSCTGSCDATMKGVCDGKCNGKCDGKASNGATCNGTCDGKCDAKIEGTCNGQCSGSCKLKASASCSGTCNGGCSAEMKEPKCTGEMKPPQMSAQCKAKCDAKVQAKAECSPASVGVKVEGTAADAKLAESYKAALEKNLPLILKVAMGVGERGVKMAGNVAAVASELEGSAQGMVKGGALEAGKLAACVAAPFKGAADAATSLKANVSVSVDVKASASASGSASGKAG
ncbi:MAG TPA: hypothetical protein VGI39_25705 [Polyangiaceae bacterium]|jgi:hypothetical protein